MHPRWIAPHGGGAPWIMEVAANRQGSKRSSSARVSVGYMLDIRPVAVKGGTPPSRMANKVRAMKQAFEDIVGSQCVFHPPLAIKLDDPDDPPKDNGHGRLQRGCQSCGGCDFGCTY